MYLAPTKTSLLKSHWFALQYTPATVNPPPATRPATPLDIPLLHKNIVLESYDNWFQFKCDLFTFFYIRPFIAYILYSYSNMIFYSPTVLTIENDCSASTATLHLYRLEKHNEMCLFWLNYRFSKYNLLLGIDVA